MRGGYGHPQVTHVMLSLDGTGNHWEAPFYFPHRSGVLLHNHHAAGRQAARPVLPLDFTREMGTHDLPNQKIRRAVLDVQVSET